MLGASVIFHGVRLIGIGLDTVTKVGLTFALIVVVLLVQSLVRAGTRQTLDPKHDRSSRFWIRQFVHLFTFVLLLFGLLSIWFNSRAGVTTFLGLLTAGVAFALQSVITAVAGYLVILRGKTFRVGERIVMGGVRGDVIGVGLLHTTIMEMGQPPPVEGADPAMWLTSRQYSGRIVTVSNGLIFSQPVYNYTRDFPYIYDQMTIPIGYESDRKKAEEIILRAVKRRVDQYVEPARRMYQALEGKYFVRPEPANLEPRVFVQIMEQYANLTVRFIAPPHGITEIKDAVTREVLDAFDQVDITIGPDPDEYRIVGMPAVNLDGSSAHVRASSRPNHEVSPPAT